MCDYLDGVDTMDINSSENNSDIGSEVIETTDLIDENTFDVSSFDADSSSLDNIESSTVFNDIDIISNIEPFDVENTNDFDIALSGNDASDIENNEELSEDIHIDSFAEDNDELFDESLEFNNEDIFETENNSVTESIYEMEIINEDKEEITGGAFLNNDLTDYSIDEENTASQDVQDEYLNDENRDATDDGIKIYTRDTSHTLESRQLDTEEVLDNFRENIGERGFSISDDVLDDYINEQRELINAEYEALNRGDTSNNIYEMPQDWDEVAQSLSDIQSNIDAKPDDLHQSYGEMGSNVETTYMPFETEPSQYETEILDNPATEEECTSSQTIEQHDLSTEDSDMYQIPFDLHEMSSENLETADDIPIINNDVPPFENSLNNNDWYEIELLSNEDINYELENSERGPSNSLEETEADYETIYEGLDNYDFDGIDCLSDIEQVDRCLDNFSNDDWETGSLADKKTDIEILKSYIQESIGLKDPPGITYYYKPNSSDYGCYNNQTNELEINTYTLERHGETPGEINVAQEAADTIAHELWHA